MMSTGRSSWTTTASLLFSVLVCFSCHHPSFLLKGVSAQNNNYYYNANQYNQNQNNNNNYQQNQNQQYQDNRDYQGNGDDGDDQYNLYRKDDGSASDSSGNFNWDWQNEGFDGLSIMPVSCVNYNNGHMIKFELFESESSYQCHFAQLGTFVVSIAHYMRAYFNYQALVNGNEFELPGDAGYLNCIMLQETAYGGQQLYAKIGCMERETYTSTKLSLHMYTDAQCSEPYDDGETARRHATKGYEVNGYTFPTRVSFRPPFYTCQSCSPAEISDTFNKKSGRWYDDDYISAHGQKNNEGDEDQDEQDQNQNKNNNGGDDFYNDDFMDDTYLSANDDINNNYWNDGGRFLLGDEAAELIVSMAAEGELEAYEEQFWNEVDAQQQRELYENEYDLSGWNMCERLYKYGVWCDDECRALDAFRMDQWSSADIILLSIMCTFLAIMMLLIVAKRLKARQKARTNGDFDAPLPGLPPTAVGVLFGTILLIVLIMAKLKFVNETLVFVVVVCILLFIYLLKLTLFDSARRRPKLLATHDDLFDNPLEDKLFA